MTDVQNIISELEQQRAAIDRAIVALRGISPPEKTELVEQVAAPGASSAPRKKRRQLSPEGRQRIIDATKKRWAAQRKANETAQKTQGKSKPSASKKPAA